MIVANGRERVNRNYVKIETKTKGEKQKSMQLGSKGFRSCNEGDAQFQEQGLSEVQWVG
jgi:hypothetical protein